jgi:hypothetical protein
MHRLILGLTSDDPLEVDHINGDRLDNRRSNLRVANQSQNLANQRKTRGASRYKGVDWHERHQLWRARIQKDGKRRLLGWFASEDEAGVAYNEAAVRLFGEYARLNVIT